MRDSLTRIERYTSGLTTDAFAADDMVIDAVVRNLATIGEAANHVPLEIQGLLPDVPWIDIRGTRNEVIHEYFSIDLEIVWEPVTRDLPPLREALERLLSHPEDPAAAPD